MEPGVSLPRSQEPATGPYPEPVQIWESRLDARIVSLTWTAERFSDNSQTITLYNCYVFFRMFLKSVSYIKRSEATQGTNVLSILSSRY
jgi:hypothetical protein